VPLSFHPFYSLDAARRDWFPRVEALTLARAALCRSAPNPQDFAMSRDLTACS
jgi:hypothetical protein